jgi:O-antigen/teichoic acid export membrane protein
MTDMDAPTEEESPRDGLFSYAGEWHSFIVGAGAGVAAAVTGQLAILAALAAVALGLEGARRALPETSRITSRVAVHELQREPWYAISGGLLGYVAGHADPAVVGAILL